MIYQSIVHLPAISSLDNSRSYEQGLYLEEIKKAPQLPEGL